MDPKDKMIADLQAQNATLVAQVAEKDTIIAQKNSDIIGIRKKYGVPGREFKYLEEMTKEELDKLTDEEKARKAETDAIAKAQEEQAKRLEEDRTRERNERIENAAKRIAPNDAEAQKKIIENFNRLKDSDAAFTEGEINTFMDTATNMLGDARPKPVHSAINAGGGMPPPVGDENGTGFADSEAGKSAAEGLGLSFAQTPPPSAGA